MAILSVDEIRHLAGLARISVSDAEVAKFQTELGSILGYVEQLSEVDTNGVAPTNQVTGLENIYRRDEDYTDTMPRDELLEQVPEVKDGQIQVPKVL